MAKKALGKYIENARPVKEMEDEASKDALYRQRLADIATGEIVVGPCKGTREFTVEILAAHGMIGLYERES